MGAKRNTGGGNGADLRQVPRAVEIHFEPSVRLRHTRVTQHDVLVGRAPDGDAVGVERLGAPPLAKREPEMPIFGQCLQDLRRAPALATALQVDGGGENLRPEVHRPAQPVRAKAQRPRSRRAPAQPPAPPPRSGRRGRPLPPPQQGRASRPGRSRSQRPSPPPSFRLGPFPPRRATARDACSARDPGASPTRASRPQLRRSAPRARAP